VHRRRRGAGGCGDGGGVVNIKAFLGDALTSALELGVGAPDDVLRHVTPEVLALCLPRPLWARLLTACMGAPKVDSQLVIDTVGIANLCEHVPSSIMWGVIAEMGAKSLGQAFTASKPVLPTARASAPLVSPPPEASVSTASAPVAGKSAASGPSIPAPANQPLADLITELEADDRPITPTRTRTPTGQRFRTSNTNVGRLGAAASTQGRRPQAQATVTVPTPTAPVAPARTARGSSDIADVVTETETAVERADWRDAIAVDDSQLVDWQASEETQTSTDDFTNKRR
jgi:hypothetical protein